MNTATGPYFDKSGRPILRESVIVVVDILGYKKEIYRASRDGQIDSLLEFVYDVICNAFPNVDDPSGIKWFAKMMSDDLVAGYPILGNGIGTFEFLQACYNAGHFQREMMKYGLPVRGGICVGRIHLSEFLVLPNDNILKEIIEVERAADFPRIILMDSSIKFLEKHWNSFTDQDKSEIEILLWNDNDSKRYLNYLRPLSGITGINKRHLLEMHKNFIEGNLEEFSNCERIYSKYIWVADYHNKFCHSVPIFSTQEFLIEPRNT